MPEEVVQTAKTEIILKDGSIFETRSNMGQRLFISGQTRDSIRFNFEASKYDMNTLYEKFNNPENTQEIIIRETISYSNDLPDNVTEYHHYDYTLMDSIKLYDEQNTRETNVEPETSIRFITVTMGQKLYTEKELDKRNGQIDDLCEVMADMIGGAE